MLEGVGPTLWTWIYRFSALVLLRPGEEVELAAGPPGRTGKNLGCSTPRTGLFQDLGNTQEAWELSSERWLPPPGSGVAGGQPLSPNAIHLHL